MSWGSFSEFGLELDLQPTLNQIIVLKKKVSLYPVLIYSIKIRELLNAYFTLIVDCVKVHLQSLKMFW